MKILPGLLGVGVLVSLGIGALKCRNSSESSSATAPSPTLGAVTTIESIAARVLDGAHGDPSGGSAIVDTANFRQVAIYEIDDSGVRLRNYERPIPPLIPSPAPLQHQPYEVTEYEYSTSYKVRSVVGRQADELYVLGRSDGDCIIEQWRNVVLDGAYYFHRAESNTPIGVPVSGVPSTSVGIQGGEYLAANRRMRPGRQQRVELLRKAGFGTPHALACDPEGRFVLFVAGDGPRTLYRLALVANSQPEAITSSATIGHAQYWSGIHPEHHNTQGRIYLAGCSGCSADGALYTTLLFDNDNDGIFELNQTQTLSLDAYEAAGYWGDVWLTDFLSE